MFKYNSGYYPIVLLVGHDMAQAGLSRRRPGLDTSSICDTFPAKNYSVIFGVFKECKVARLYAYISGRPVHPSSNAKSLIALRAHLKEGSFGLDVETATEYFVYSSVTAGACVVTGVQTSSGR